MNIVTAILIMSFMVLCSGVIIFIANKKISASIALKLNPDLANNQDTKSTQDKKEEQKSGKSPYNIKRYYNKPIQDNIYYIFKNNSRVDDSYFYVLEDAVESMNELEMLEGYEITKFSKAKK